MDEERRNKEAALRESLISTMIAYKRIQLGEFDTGGDIRATIGEKLDELADELVADETSWPYVKDRYLYDVYLQMREEEGTITEYDKVRPGLTMGLFSTSAEYHKHCVRVGDSRETHKHTGSKTCNECGCTKPAHKFPHRGGAICFACRSKKYRERTKNRAS